MPDLSTEPTSVSAEAVMRMLYNVGGAGQYAIVYAEIAEAIARASTSDPLFPAQKAGSEMTACILVALAWHRSKFAPYANTGRYVGLYQIRPPSYPVIPFSSLAIPREASLIAIDLIRESFVRCRTLLWSERLAWLHDLGATDGPVTTEITRARSDLAKRSTLTMSLARNIFEKTFGSKYPASSDFAGSSSAPQPRRPQLPARAALKRATITSKT